MEWINIHAPTLRAPEYIGSEPLARATWFNVLAYCCEQENNGRIVGGAGWKDRQLQQTCGVTREEVMASAPLLEIDGNDVVVWRYPSEKQDIVQARREAGSKGGKSKGSSKPEAKPKQNPALAPTEGKGMEEEGNKREEEGGEPNRPLHTKDSWLARVGALTVDDWSLDWWERKWHYAEKTGWLSGSRPITNWEAHQDSLMTYFRSDSSERKAKTPAVVDVEALERANLEQRQKEQAEIRDAVLNGSRE
jgi:hypothetical protein